jgi:hypothetical protein
VAATSRLLAAADPAVAADLRSAHADAERSLRGLEAVASPSQRPRATSAPRGSPSGCPSC